MHCSLSFSTKNALRRKFSLDGGGGLYYNREKIPARSSAPDEKLRKKDDTMKIGFIGTGNMGGALASAAAKSAQAELLLANRTPEKAQALAEAIGARVCDNAAAAGEADHLFLGVKPQMMAGMLEKIAPVLKAREKQPVLVSMAAGLSIESIRAMAGGDYPVIRIMPNMPAAVGEGVIFYACSENCEKADVEAFLSYMAPAGRLFALEERLQDAGSAVAGCGPAFAAMFLEALADGGVACGLPRADAVRYAAQMMLGTAKMVLDTGEHPGALKDRVCSPGGSTIQGVRALETAGLRGAVFNAVIAAYEKNCDLKNA